MKDTNPYRERQWYRFGKGALISLLLAIVIPIPLLMSMFSMKAYSSVAIYIIFWAYLVFVIIFFVRKSRSNAYHIVDETVIKKTSTDLHNSRVIQRNTFLAAEIAELQKGKKIPVLDYWKTETQLHAQHSYFSRLVHIVIDPQQKELELLIQLPAIRTFNADEVRVFRLQFLHRITEFIKIAAGEAHLQSYFPFFSTVILECDSLREDDKGYDIPFPVFSMALPAEYLPRLASMPPYQEVPFYQIADVRFSDGNEITPHRTIIITP
ncbi:MAG: hypothetical protein WCX28_08200 [Bacteriovoracaceae bacterium]